MNRADLQYLANLRNILVYGTPSKDRTGTGTLSIFGAQMRFDLQDGFPLLTTKKVSFDVVAKELLWMLSGDTKVKTLQDQGVKIWDGWVKEDGTIGPGGYGAAWRAYPDGSGGTVDQIANVIESIKKDPYSRRHMVMAWHPGLVDQTALPPCHYGFQFYVRDGLLSCHFTMRSNDFLLGNPYNIASYALLTHMVAQQTGLEVGQLLYTGTDVHLYSNHIEQAKEQLTRKPYPLPRLELDMAESIDHYTREHMRVVGYEHHPAIKAEVSV